VRALKVRGRCPRLLEPMETGDGLLVRIPSRAVHLCAWAHMCRAARAYGNGTLEITRRGSLQIRGITTHSVSALVDELMRAGFEEPVGPIVLTTPWPDGDLASEIDTEAIAAELRADLRRQSWATSLHPKTSILIDAGSSLHFDAITFDLRLRFLKTDRGPMLTITLEGDDAPRPAQMVVSAADTVSVARDLLAFLSLRGSTVRIRDIVEMEGPEVFWSLLGDRVVAATTPPSRTRAQPIGLHRIGEQTYAVGIGIPLGSMSADAFERLIDTATKAQAESLRPWERHTALFSSFDRGAAEAFQAEAGRLGFIVRDDDPYRNITTCVGSPACSRGQMQTRELCQSIRRTSPSLLDGSLTIHVAGCDKACGKPTPTTITLTGMEDGCELTIGAQEDARREHWTALEVPKRLRQISEKIELMRRDHQQACDVLALAIEETRPISHEGK